MHNTHFVSARRLIAGLAFMLWAASLWAQSGTSPEFPANPAAWINSPPLSKGNLAGKAAFLWFFEEDCPRCRERWPGLLTLAQQFQGKPIVFMAVNSGSPRQEVEQYVKANRINWPVLVDFNREFEKAAGVNEISLQNIYQVRLLMPDGSLRPGSWSEVEASANQALQGAAWKVDPEGVPESLRGAWLAIELGNYAAAATAVKRGVNNARPEVKQAAEKLQAAAEEEIDRRMAQAKTALDTGNKWSAYKTFVALAEELKGFDLPPEAAAQQKQLATDPAVSGELAALRTLESAKKLLSAPSPASRKRGIGLLERLTRDAPLTEAAQEAQTLLQGAGG